MEKTELWLRKDFDTLYKLYPDPWGCEAGHDIIYNKIMLEILKEYCNGCGWVLDVGCGKGSLTKEIASKLEAKTIGIDTSMEAVREAQNDGMSYFTCANIMDGTTENLGKFNLVVMAEVIWYICEEMREVLERIKRMLVTDGYLCIKQYFPDVQNYYTNEINGVSGLHDYIHDWTICEDVLCKVSDGTVVILVLRRK